MKESPVDNVIIVDPKKYKSSLPFEQIDWDLANSEEDQGLIAVGGKLDVGTLFQAYYNGIFPWPHEDHPLLWFSPDPRGILRFKNWHWPTKMKKKWKTWRPQFELTTNKAFEQVMLNCQAQKRKGQAGTWITPEMQKAYLKFHQAGFAHSVEVWREGQLVGGGYGVFVQGVFSGESLFHHEDDVSKLALWHMTEKLKAMGLEWMDTQMVTPLVRALGGEEVSRSEYFQLLFNTHRRLK